MSKRVICIWLPNWPSQRATVATLRAEPLRPESRGAGSQPLILYRRDPRRGNVVATANQTARRLGVLPQMPMSQCGPLCPDAVCIEHDPQADLEVLTQLAEGAQCFSPIVGLETLESGLWAGRSLHEPQCLFADITGIAPLFGGELAFANAVDRWFRDAYYLPVIGIANQVGQAWAVANYSMRSSVSDGLFRWEEYLARVSRDDSQPTRESVDGGGLSACDLPPWIRILTSSIQGQVDKCFEDESLLRKLPIESLRLDLVNVTKLHRLGVRTVMQLIELPRASLTSRFGENLLHRIDQLVGDEWEPIQTLHPSPEFSIETTYEYATPNQEDVAATVQEHLRHLGRQLDSIGHGALRVVCRIALEPSAFDVGGPMDGSAEQKIESTTSARASVLQIGLFQPTSDPEHIAWLLQTQWENCSRSFGGSHWAKGVTTQITLSAPITWKQSNLFDSESLQHKLAIAKLVDSLSVRLGRENVLSPSLVSNPLPEWSYVWKPMTGRRKDGTLQETQRKLKKPAKRDYQQSETSIGPKKEDVWRRPIRLLSSPSKLLVTEKGPSGLPTIIRYPRANCDVVRCTGPERLESGWWHGAMQRRDYYRIELQNGIWLWCYWDRQSREWYLHGLFD